MSSSQMEMGDGGVDRTDLAQDREKWRYLFNLLAPELFFNFSTLCI